MRVFAAVLLTLGLAASPLLARNAGESGKEESPAAASNTTAAAENPTPKEAVKAENSAIESEMQDLRSLVEEQRAELEAQRAALKAAETKMKELEEKINPAPAEPVAAPAAAAEPAVAITPGTAATAAIGPASPTASAALAAQGGEGQKESPLYVKIGGAEFYPLGFMDLTGVFRTTNLGGIGTSFGSIPFNNALPGRLSEFRFSAQNSRIGLRTHAKFGEADVTGYLEADFLGYQPANANDTSNSNTFRMRLYWVDYRRGKIELFGGQSWSFLTPNRNGLSALPGDLFYGQEMDTNYLLGLTWARQPAFRVILHPTENWALGVSLENPEQTLPSSVIPPAGTVTSLSNFQPFDSNSGNTSSTTGVNNPNTPNLHPDVIVKTAFDAKPGGHQVHFDVAGLFRTFKAINLIQTPLSSSGSSVSSSTTVDSTIHGGGVEGGANIELFKNFRVIGTAFYSYGGGRYIASTGGPDLIIRPDETLSGIRSGSGIGGFEWQANSKTMLYGYYSGAYFGKNVNGVTTTTGGVTTTTYTGYGFPGSSSSADRYLYEPTFGVVQTFWRNPSYGDLKLITQYSYVSRTPWNIGTSGPATAHTSMVYIDLRYDLP